MMDREAPNKNFPKITSRQNYRSPVEAQLQQCPAYDNIQLFTFIIIVIAIANRMKGTKVLTLGAGR